MNTWLNRGPPVVGAVTVIAEVPLFPSEVAAMVAEPAARPVTSPVPLTRAIALSPLDQVTARPVSGLPLASFSVAVSCTVWPICTLGDAGLTATDATAAVSGREEEGGRACSQLEPRMATSANVAAATDQCFDGKSIHAQPIEGDARESVTRIIRGRAR